MRRVKTLAKVLVGVILIVGLANQAVSAQKRFAGTTIYAAMFRAPASSAAEKLIGEFEKETGIKVVFDIYPYMSLREKTMMNFIGRTGAYDLVMADCIWVSEYAAAQFLQELKPYMDDPTLFDADAYKLDDIVPSQLDYLGCGEKGGPVVGIPFMTNTTVLVYRKDLYDKYVKPAGIREPGKTRADAWTFDEYVEAAKLLTKDFNGDGRIDQWGTTLQAKRGNSLVWEFYHIFYALGGRDFDYDTWECLLDTPISIKALQWYVDLVRKHKVAPPAVTTWAHDEELAALTEGLCAMDATWNIEESMWLVDPSVSKVANVMEHAMQLHVPGIPRPSIGGGYGLLLARDSKHPEAAFKFLTWITSPEVHKKLVMDGGTPIRWSQFEDADIMAKFPFYDLYKKVIDITAYRLRVPEWSQIEAVLAIGLSQAMIGELTAEEACKDMAMRSRFIMERAGYPVK